MLWPLAEIVKSCFFSALIYFVIHFKLKLNFVVLKMSIIHIKKSCKFSLFVYVAAILDYDEMAACKTFYKISMQLIFTRNYPGSILN